MVAHLSDLEPVEVAFLGVLSLGLPPSRAAGDDTFRVDHCTAVVEGLRESGDASLHLVADGPGVSPEFALRLRKAVASLTARGVLAEQPAGLPAAAGGYEAGLLIDVVNPDLQPAVLDRWLGQQCMDSLLGVPDVYPFLMRQYARAGEFWRRAREAGYGS